MLFQQPSGWQCGSWSMTRKTDTWTLKQTQKCCRLSVLPHILRGIKIRLAALISGCSRQLSILVQYKLFMRSCVTPFSLSHIFLFEMRGRKRIFDLLLLEISSDPGILGKCKCLSQIKKYTINRVICLHSLSWLKPEELQEPWWTNPVWAEDLYW